MSSIAVETERLMDALPEEYKVIAYEYIKELVLRLDPDLKECQVLKLKN